MATHDESPQDVLRRYLVDAIAAEKNFETQLRGMAKEGDSSAAQQVFAQHADETKSQWERLTARLHALGGEPSTFKSVMATLFNFAPKTAQLGHSEAEKSTQDLIIAFAVENSEIATYEALATVAAAAGDVQTEQLAREIQKEEERAAQKVWNLLAPTARIAYQNLTQAA